MKDLLKNVEKSKSLSPEYNQSSGVQSQDWLCILSEPEKYVLNLRKFCENSPALFQ